MEQAKPAKSPDAFRTISEAATELGLPQHVLRFWESKFPQIKPMKRAGGRRYYRREDLVLLTNIKDLLHSEGYTIKGVQKMLRQNNGRFPDTTATSGSTIEAQNNTSATNAIESRPTTINNDEILAAIGELESVRDTLQAARKGN
ncbi:MAG: MerR family transcriptional regulator [Rhodospirillales bacterium]|jgi:DNA-binding transcriptional MerR regulator|nr:MerR family transcriptional regulator [Rhodospirillales bacterium]